jgi:glycosyltransferase 2 family protein
VLRALAGLALVGAILWYLGPESLARVLRDADLPTMVGALALAIVSNVLSAARWAAIARAFHLEAPFAPLVAMYARGITSNTLLPGATLSGDALRSYELSRLGNPLVESAASVAFCRLSGLWTLCVMSLVAAGIALAAGLSLDAGGHGGRVLAAYGSLLAAIVVGPFLPWPLHRLRALPLRAAGRLADLWARLRAPDTDLRRSLWRSLWLSILVQVFSAFALAACGLAVGADVPIVLMLACAAPIFVMAAVPLGVAGFGTRELAAVAVLGLAGVPAATAAATGLLYGVLGVAQGVLSAPLFLRSR